MPYAMCVFVKMFILRQGSIQNLGYAKLDA